MGDDFDFFDSPGRGSKPSKFDRKLTDVDSFEDDLNSGDSQSGSPRGSPGTSKASVSVKIEARIPTASNRSSSDSASSDDFFENHARKVENDFAHSKRSEMRPYELGGNSNSFKSKPKPTEFFSNDDSDVNSDADWKRIGKKPPVPAKQPNTLKRKPPIKEKLAWCKSSSSDSKTLKYDQSESVDGEFGDGNHHKCHVTSDLNDEYESQVNKKKSGQCRYSEVDESSHSEDSDLVSPKDSRPFRPVSRCSKRSHSSESSDASRSSKWSTGSEVDCKHNHKPETSGSDSDSISVSSLSEEELANDQNTQRPTEERVEEDMAWMGRNAGNRSIDLEDKDKDRMNLKQLLSALLNAEDEQAKVARKKNVLIVPNDRKKQRSNYSFSEEQARLIDMENQRLLHNIITQTAATHMVSQAQKTVKKEKRKDVSNLENTRVTHATLNRIREQQRVERENLALLRRLNQVKPSKELSRDRLIVDYQRQISYHCPSMRVPKAETQQMRKMASKPDDLSASRRGRPQSASFSKPLSLNVTYSRPLSAGHAQRTRPSSAGSSKRNRPTSASSAKLQKRPDWETGW